MKYDFNINSIVLGPSCSGKTIFISNFIKNYNNLPTIGVDIYKLQLKYKNDFYKLNIWDTGNGLLYRNIMDKFLYLSNIYIIINVNNNYDFIKQIFEIINNNTKKKVSYIMIVYNKIDNNDNFKYDETFIKKINKNQIKINFFYLNLSQKVEANKIIDNIKEYTEYLKYNNFDSDDIDQSTLCCSIC
tara:strand:- start:26 stop:586 length:561 start_codon:yes stop_codon:yes gene_type:complete